MHRRTITTLWRLGACALALLAPLGSSRAIDLADSPLFATNTAPGNLLLALSVEWPTASTPAYHSTVAYTAGNTYLGYFDPEKCYRYVAVNSGTSSSPNYSTSYFQPDGAATSHACTSTSSKALWSGNFLNWSTTQTLDAFRWVLTGGTRSVDSSTATILQKTYHNGSGDHNNPTWGVYPDKVLATGVSGATPFNWSSVTARIWKGGYRLWVTGSNTAIGSDAVPEDSTGPLAVTDYVGQSSAASTADAGTIYQLYVQVKVCDPTVGVESNCTAYGSAYKPEGLMQKYASRLRYSAFGYLNDYNGLRDGAVMRARMKYIGPTSPAPGSSPVTNSAAEWNASTGVMLTNPDSSDAAATMASALSQTGFTVSITNSGVMNYLNKFGSISHSYKSYDSVGELYYAGLRYFRNLGNVTEYSDLRSAGSAAKLTEWLDDFPVITNWSDPIAYTCQKNFILGIGDVFSWNDANLYGSTIRGTVEPSMPAQVAADTLTDVQSATNMVGQLEGLGSLGTTYTTHFGSSGQNTYFIAGLAYDAHTRDQRSDLAGSQTVSTYWVDVLERQTYISKNQYWLAAKYGGFTLRGEQRSRHPHHRDVEQRRRHGGLGSKARQLLHRREPR